MKTRISDTRLAPVQMPSVLPMLETSWKKGSVLTYSVTVHVSAGVMCTTVRNSWLPSSSSRYVLTMEHALHCQVHSWTVGVLGIWNSVDDVAYGKSRRCYTITMYTSESKEDPNTWRLHSLVIFNFGIFLQCRSVTAGKNDRGMYKAFTESAIGQFFFFIFLWHHFELMAQEILRIGS